MSDESPRSQSNALFDFLNKTSGKIIAFITLVTAVSAFLKLVVGEFRLSVIILLSVIAVTIWLSALYIYFKKRETRQTTPPRGVETITKPFYSLQVRRIAFALIIGLPLLCVTALFYSRLTSHGTRAGMIDSLLGEKITLGGIVINASGEPADNTAVTLQLNNREITQVAPGGKFSFPQIDISQETSKTLALKFRWRNIESTETVDLSAGSRDDLIFILPAGDPPFKVEYRVFGGNAIDFLVKGRVDKQWEGALGEQPFIVVNDVFTNLRTIQAKFSVPFSYNYFNVESNRSDLKKNLPDQWLDQKSQGERLLSLYEPDYGRTPSREELLSVFNQENRWNLAFVSGHWWGEIYSGAYSTEAFVFWKFADANDLQRFRSKKRNNSSLDFYSFITKNYLPPDFILLVLYVESLPSGCGGSTGTWLAPREPQLRVALVENISEQPLRIGKFSIKRSDPGRLRSLEENEAAFNAKKSEQKVLFPPEYLKPHEKILIPLELFFDSPNLNSSFSEEALTQESTEEEIGKLKKYPRIKFVLTDEKSAPVKVDVKTSDLIKLIRQPKEEPRLNKAFVFGPTVKIENLEVDGVTYPFRPLDTSTLVLKGGGDVGSCPYAYTYSPESDAWISEGVFLYRMKGKRAEATEEKELNRFDGRIVVREQDPEISFIDSVLVKVLTAAGKEKLLYPKNRIVRFTDGRYLTLKRGDQVMIEFDVPQGILARKYVLITQGYYLPD